MSRKADSSGTVSEIGCTDNASVQLTGGHSDADLAQVRYCITVMHVEVQVVGGMVALMRQPCATWFDTSRPPATQYTGAVLWSDTNTQLQWHPRYGVLLRETPHLLIYESRQVCADELPTHSIAVIACTCRSTHERVLCHTDAGRSSAKEACGSIAMHRNTALHTGLPVST
jgi:hypothetical protein